MGRPRKEGRKAPGIYNKSGYLYLVTSKSVIKDGKKKSIPIWTHTGLTDTPENLKKAIDLKNNLKRTYDMKIIERGITFGRFRDIYLDYKKRVLADTTYAAYEYKSRHIVDYFKDVKVKSITPDNINEFLDYLFIEKNLSKRTVEDIKMVFGSIMRYAIDKNVITVNPVDKAEISKRLAAEHLSKRSLYEEFFSSEEANYFLNKIKDDRFYPIAHTAICFGLRRSELLGIKWSAIDFKEKRLHIGHTVTYGTHINRRDAVKTESSRRTYPLDDSQIQMFLAIRKREETERKAYGPAYNENDYVFKNLDGQPYDVGYPTKKFKKLVRSIPELPQNVTFHSLRKSCVSILVKQGFDIKYIQTWVGQRDITTTLVRYALVKEQESKLEILNGMMGMIPVFQQIDDE